jgi:hypothetical protein
MLCHFPGPEVREEMHCTIVASTGRRFKMKKLTRAAEAWLWTEVLLKLAGLVAVGVVMGLAWLALRGMAGVLGI